MCQIQSSLIISSVFLVTATYWCAVLDQYVPNFLVGTTGMSYQYLISKPSSLMHSLTLKHQGLKQVQQSKKCLYLLCHACCSLRLVTRSALRAGAHQALNYCSWLRVCSSNRYSMTVCYPSTMWWSWMRFTKDTYTVTSCWVYSIPCFTGDQTCA